MAKRRKPYTNETTGWRGEARAEDMDNDYQSRCRLDIPRVYCLHTTKPPQCCQDTIQTKFAELLNSPCIWSKSVLTTTSSRIELKSDYAQFGDRQSQMLWLGEQPVHRKK